MPSRADNGELEHLWWMSEEAVCGIALKLQESNFVVLDHFVGEPNVVASLRQRSVLLGSTGGPSGYDALTMKTDLLMSKICKCAVCPPELKESKFGRKSLCVARLAPGASQGRHVDSGRVDQLTVLYYMQDANWDESTHGGVLRIFRPEASGEKVASPGQREAELEYRDVDVIADLAPLSDRLVVFFSDFRCPHAVLAPKVLDRYAAVLFYGAREGADSDSEEDKGSYQDIFAMSFEDE